MADCLFCKIAAGEIPADLVIESEVAMAFRDVNPQAPTHVLVIPRTHVDNAHVLQRGQDPILGEMLELARSVAEIEGIETSGYRLVFNVGDDAGNTVPHLHMHVLGGRRMAWPPG
jgi:histidine triad (HIT) family protein